jgi:hypothetical protein
MQFLCGSTWLAKGASAESKSCPPRAERILDFLIKDLIWLCFGDIKRIGFIHSQDDQYRLLDEQVVQSYTWVRPVQ